MAYFKTTIYLSKAENILKTDNCFAATIFLTKQDGFKLISTIYIYYMIAYMNKKNIFGFLCQCEMYPFT